MVTPMDENRIRQIVNEEIRKNESGSRFGLKSIPNHSHNGVDSLRIKEDNLIQSVSVSGNITFSSSDEYTIYLNSSFTPSSILAYGNIVGSGDELYMSIGSANLVPSFYLQPDTTRTVVTGNIQYPFIDPNLDPVTTVPLQSSCYFGADDTTGNVGGIHTLSSEGHIVNVFYSSTIFARATVTTFSKDYIKFQTTIASGWSMNINYVIT